MPTDAAAPLQRGSLVVRAALDKTDQDRALALRAQVFRSGHDDRDALDAHCLQVLVQDCRTDSTLAAFRLLPMASGAGIDLSYSAQFYDLSALRGFSLPIVELGRFCTAPDCLDPDVIRLCWAFITREVDARGAGMLCGCTSFAGADAGLHRAALAALRRHAAPPERAPLPKAAAPGSVQSYPYARLLDGYAYDPRAALAGMPALLRTYLAMGGWVSDHAVLDTDLDTLHVFTAVEIAAIPQSRSRALRALAGTAI